MRHSFDLSDRAECDRHCMHGVKHADCEDGLAWCCRCGNLLIVPRGFVYEEKTHGCFPPKLLRISPERTRLGISIGTGVQTYDLGTVAELREDK